MNTLIEHSIASSTILIILFLVYRLLFSKNSFFKTRRFVLLAILVVSILAPLVEIEQPASLSSTLPDLPSFSQLVITPESSPLSADPILSKTTEYTSKPINWLLTIFISGLGISILLTLKELSASMKWIKRSSHKRVNYLEEVKAPFSLFNKVFLPQALINSDKGEVIIAHEEFHCNQRHTLDILIAKVVGSFFWYNPVNYLLIKELKLVHEAMADQHVTHSFGQRKYLEVLLAVRLSSFDLTLQNTFNSQISQRLKLMNTPKSSKVKTAMGLMVLAIIPMLFIGMQSAQAQKEGSIESSFYQDRSALDSMLANPNRLMVPVVTSGRTNNIPDALAIKVKKLQEKKPNVNIRYVMVNDAYSYLAKSGSRPMYITELTDADRAEVYEKMRLDTARFFFDADIKKSLFVTYGESIPELKSLIDENYRYFVVYEFKNAIFHGEEFIFTADEVDQPAEVFGGIEAFQNAIALDSRIPKNLDKSRLPKTIDFEFVVRGASNISNIELLTELDGSDKKTLPYYRFFGQVHDTMKDKIARYYHWKRAVKDGKEVLMKVRISIPTDIMDSE